MFCIIVAPLNAMLCGGDNDRSVAAIFKQSGVVNSSRDQSLRINDATPKKCDRVPAAQF
jgi:hypothetical protein